MAFHVSLSSITVTNPKFKLCYYKYKSPHSSYLQDPLLTKPARFLTNTDLANLQTLQKFTYKHQIPSGSISIRLMKPEELDMTAALLSESFAESMLLFSSFAGAMTLLMYLVKEYLLERRGRLPHAATLVGFYGKSYGEEEEKLELAGTVEMSFDEIGANDSPPTPVPPKNAPYICNMTVKENLRRKGIGWHLLKASEELIAHMNSSGEVYLHCRMIDEAALNMYRKAGYSIVKTDSILILLLLQRRKHLMCKKLPFLKSAFEMDVSGSDGECSS